MTTLVFIDTNIFLDFYRNQSQERGLSVLKLVDGNHDRIITTNQVEMEFKKNRQGLLLEAMAALKDPQWQNLEPPALLRGANPHRTIVSSKKKVETARKQMTARLQRWLEEPSRHDEVYKCAQRLFRDSREVNLDIERKERHAVRRLALKRFLMGYPPRKRGDTSYGDAINWEWVVHCARQTGQDVVIVSRDSDYGVKAGKRAILNDWLKQEFRDRVSKRRRVELTARLTEGLKLAGVQVSDKAVEDEEKLVESLSIRPSSIRSGARIGTTDIIRLLSVDDESVVEDWEPEVDDIGD